MERITSNTDPFEIGLSLATQGVYNDPPFDVTRAANETEVSPRGRYNTLEDAEDAALLAAFKREVRR